MTLREQEIHAWISSLYPTMDLANLHYLQSDASSRKYMRLQAPSNTYVIMDTKPDQELNNFLQITQILHAHNINTPEIIQANIPQGLVLMTDLGVETYQQALQHATPQKIDSLYLDAITTLVKIQRIDIAATKGYTFNTMDAEYIHQRLEVFKNWYLQKHLGISVDATIDAQIAKMQKIFEEVFAELPAVLVHVDYHCRNLMHTVHSNPGVLDYQDAMCGPPTYDLVSLLQDAYITWPRAQVEAWVQTYMDIAVAAGILQPLPINILLRHFDLVGLQRHIKNLGVFARLHHRDNKSNYLQDIPTLLKYIQETCSRYKEVHWLLEFIMEEVQG